MRFEPEQVVLPGGESAPVVPARTVGGELVVPDDIRTVGWWDGSAYAGDLFGSTVIAGHVDAPRQGRGYFARLLRITPGETVTVRGEGHRAAYRVVSVEAVRKDALSAASPPFDQRVGHRLVLMTCTGAFDPVTRSYDREPRRHGRARRPGSLSLAPRFGARSRASFWLPLVLYVYACV